MKYVVRETSTGNIRFVALIGCGPNAKRATKLRQAVVWALGNNQSLAHCDLSDADLAGLNLNTQNLFNCNFTDADLTRTNLNEANVSRCDFIRADLTDALFRNANITMANFSGATITNACFLTDRGLAIGLDWR